MARGVKLNLGGADRMGPSLRDEVQGLNRRRVEERTGRGRTMISWAHAVPERGVKLNFDDFPFQREWYSEEVANAREAVWMKAAQVGMSTMAWRWAARRAEQFGDSVIYFFPTDDDVAAFGDQRIEPSIEASELLQKAIPKDSVRHKHLKRIGTGWLALRGTQSKSAVQSVDADSLIFDEYDYLHKENVAQAERRIAGSKAAGRFPRIRRLGYPTIAGYGIHLAYERSDKRQWHVTCAECGEEQVLNWSENMRWRSEPGGEVFEVGRDEYDEPDQVAEAWRVCGACEASLEPPEGERFGAIHGGRWIATAESDMIGFHVNRLIVPGTDLKELVRNSRLTQPHELEAFWNNDMGMPYSPSEAALTDADIDAACSLGGEPASGPRARAVRVGGLDVASARRMNLWIDELRPNGTMQAVHLSEPADFEEAVETIRRLGVNLLVVDAMPEKRSARALAATFPGRVILAEYDPNDRADAFKYDPKKNVVRINRTEGIDAFQDGIRQQRRIPLRRPPRRFKSQLLAPKRRTELSASGVPRRVYVSTGTDGDDYTHAGVYGLVAKELWALRVQVTAQVEDARGHRVPNERRGYAAADEYRPGFGERL
jgi:hypothetical protein